MKQNNLISFVLVMLTIVSVGVVEANMSDLFKNYSTIKQPPSKAVQQEDYKDNTHSVIDTTPSRPLSGIQIKLPRYVENPSVVPITIIFDKPIENGDVFTMLDPKGHVVFKVEPKLDATINHVSTRFRLIGPGKSKLIIKRRKNEFFEYKYINQIDSDSFASIPDTPFDKDNTKNYKQKPKGNSIKMLFENSMSRENFISSVVVDSSGGPVNLTLTPLLPKNPYFKLAGDIPNPLVKSVELSRERYSVY